MKTIINKIKAIFENMLEYIGFHYVGYKVDIEINAKEIKAIKDELKALKNSRIVENFNIQFDDINDKLINIKKDVDVARCEGLINKDNIKANKNNIDNNYTCIENLEDNIQSVENRLDCEMDFINEDQLHDAFYDFKQEHINKLNKKVKEMDGEIEDLYHDRLVYGDDDYNNRLHYEERLEGLGINEDYVPRVNKSIESATIKHLKEVLNNNKKHNELIENLLNELCELNNLKEDK